MIVRSALVVLALACAASADTSPPGPNGGTARPTAECVSLTHVDFPKSSKLGLCAIFVRDEYQICPTIRNREASQAADRRRGEKLAGALRRAGLIGPPDFENAYPGCFMAVVRPDALATVLARRVVDKVQASCCGELL